MTLRKPQAQNTSRDVDNSGQNPPQEQSPKVHRHTYSLRSQANADGRERHTVTMPRRGPNRERARETIMKLLSRGQVMNQRVAFMIAYLDGSRYLLGGKGGYDPARALTQCRIEQDDPLAWLHEQLHDQREHRRSEQTRQAIVEVHLLTWPTAKPRCAGPGRESW